MRLRNPDFMTIGAWNYVTMRNGEASASDNGAEVKFSVLNNPDGTRTIARDGRLTIHLSGDRDPDWRDAAERKFGVGCGLATAFSGSLICPHTQRVIPVSRIEGNPVLWVDYEHRIAIRSGGVTYETPSARPAPREKSTPIKYSFANRKAETALLKRLRPIWEEAKLRISLCEVPHGFTGYATEQCLKMVAANPEMLTFADVAATPEGGDNLKHVMSLAWGLNMCRPWEEEYWMSRVKAWAADTYSSPYLEVKS